VTDVQAVFAELQRVLGLSLTCGSITLNVNESKLQSVKTETYQRVDQKPLDRRTQPSS